MQVTPSNFTIAEYCEQMKADKIVVNHEYQRSNKVWPPAARSYLIETILLGFPIPKLSLYLKTDIKSRQTIKEIVDGQQRSQTILSYFQDEFAISIKGLFSGKRFSQLEEQYQAVFLQYQLSVDLFVGGTPSDIREVFRRMNSYTVPLNSQEKRHARYQGDFKWFVVDLTKKYAQTLKDMGVFSETQLTRMADATLLTEITMGMFEGITSGSESRTDQFYQEHDNQFLQAAEINQRFDYIFDWLLTWRDIHRTSLMKSYNVYTLALAIAHHLNPIQALSGLYQVNRVDNFQNDIVLANLSTLNAALEEPREYAIYNDFIAACSSGTNRLNQRQTRFKYYCRALEPRLI